MLYENSVDEIIEFWTKIRSRDMTPNEFYRKGIEISKML